MRRYRGRAATLAADQAVTERLVDRVASEREAAVRVWRPHRQVAFGRRDAATDGYERAQEAARERDFPTVEREVGGRAVAFTGTTVAFARATPVADPRSGLGERYDAATRDLRAALADLGIAAEPGEPPDAFCPGSHSLQATGGDGQSRKIAGLAQRVRQRTALVAGLVLVADHDAVAAVLTPVYDALAVPFDPDAVGSVARAGGVGDPTAVVEAIGDALTRDVDESDVTVEDVR